MTFSLILIGESFCNKAGFAACRARICRVYMYAFKLLYVQLAMGCPSFFFLIRMPRIPQGTLYLVRVCTCKVCWSWNFLRLDMGVTYIFVRAVFLALYYGDSKFNITARSFWAKPCNCFAANYYKFPV